MGCNQLQLGEQSYGDIRIVGRAGTVRVGKYCSIASNVQAIMWGHNTNWITTYPFGAREIRGRWQGAEGCVGHPKFYGNIEIGNDVWIGQNVILLGGIRVGNGAVIAAGSVVSMDVQPYTIVGGAPAKYIRSRFCFWQIEALQSIAWWNWPKEKIEQELGLLCSDNISDFIEKHRVGNKNEQFA